MGKETPKKSAWLFFTLYMAVMVVLLFLRVPREGHPYNLTPLATIRTCADLLRRSDPVALMHRRYAWVNLLGNVAVFVPLWIFLPHLFKSQRNVLMFLMTVSLSICLIEGLQLLTRRGALDIDDLILNVPGACLGWLLWKLWNRKSA